MQNLEQSKELNEISNEPELINSIVSFVIKNLHVLWILRYLLFIYQWQVHVNDVIVKKKKSFSHHLNLVKYHPYLLAMCSMVIGFSASEGIFLTFAGFAAVLATFGIFLDTLRVAQYPTKIFESLVDALKSSEGERMMRAIFLVAQKRMGKSHKDTFLEISEGMDDLVGELDRPTVPLMLFLFRYIFAVLLTLVTYSIVIKANVVYPDAFSNLHYVLASVVRFTAADTLDVVLNKSHLSLWVLALESTFTFLYLVIAVIAFSTNYTQSAKDLQECLKHYVTVYATRTLAEVTIKKLTKRSVPDGIDFSI